MKRFVVILAVLSALVAAAPASAQDGATLTVSPNRALEDGDIVEAQGTGFAPGATVFLMLCNGDERLGDIVARCGLVGSGSAGYVTDEFGGFITQFGAPVGQVGASELAVCPPTNAQASRGVACSIEVSKEDLTQVAGVSVTYAGQAPAATDLAFTGLRGAVFLPYAGSLIVAGLALLLAATLLQRRSRRNWNVSEAVAQLRTGI